MSFDLNILTVSGRKKSIKQSIWFGCGICKYHSNICRYYMIVAYIYMSIL